MENCEERFLKMCRSGKTLISHKRMSFIRTNQKSTVCEVEKTLISHERMSFIRVNQKNPQSVDDFNITSRRHPS